MTHRWVSLVLVLGGSTAHADPEGDAITTPRPEPVSSPMTSASPVQLRPQLQADLGLSVIYGAYELPVAKHFAVEIGGGIFGTYFLPWFDRGDDVKGLGVGTRATWFLREGGHGPYVAPYVRVVGVRGEKDGMSGNGVGFSTGAFVGWAFGLTERLDLRVGAGAQYIHVHVDTEAGELRTSTPFVALDLLVGYRL